jgi:hypothetical protein
MAQQRVFFVARPAHIVGLALAAVSTVIDVENVLADVSAISAIAISAIAISAIAISAIAISAISAISATSAISAISAIIAIIAIATSENVSVVTVAVSTSVIASNRSSVLFAVLLSSFRGSVCIDALSRDGVCLGAPCCAHRFTEKKTRTIGFRRAVQPQRHPPHRLLQSLQAQND